MHEFDARMGEKKITHYKLCAPIENIYFLTIVRDIYIIVGKNTDIQCTRTRNEITDYTPAPQWRAAHIYGE